MTLFKSSVGLTLATLCAAVLCYLSGLFTGTWIGGAFLLLLPILWALWLCCAVLDRNINVWRLIALWILIDVTVLVLLSFIHASIAGKNGPRGDDIALVIAFSPIFLPMFLASYLSEILGTGISAIGSGAASILLGGNLPKSVISDWISMTTISAIPSYIFVWLLQFWRPKVKNNVH